MQFCLHYTGRLKSRDNASGKHAIRAYLHPQIAALFKTPALSQFVGRSRMPDELAEFSRVVGGKTFHFVVGQAFHVVASLNIIVLLPGASGHLLTNGGDIDNRIKTLLDALRTPAASTELPRPDSFDYSDGGMCCLLENDNLVDRLTIQVHRDLAPVDKHSVRCLVEVSTRVTQTVWKNLSFV
jgi:hypothetical protein